MNIKEENTRRNDMRPTTKLLLLLILILLLIDASMIASVLDVKERNNGVVNVSSMNENITAGTDRSKHEQVFASISGTTEPTQNTFEAESAETSYQIVADSEPTEIKKEFLPYLQEYYNENEDIVGWIKIEGTKLDYPLMYTPNDPEKYLHLNFDGRYSYGGLPFVDANCSLMPESDNLIIYGHNMVNGSMFRTLMKYDQKDYWEKHPVIRLDLIDEERKYEIVAAFYDRVYFTYETCFKFYQFIDAKDQAHFEEAMSYYRSNSLYDTGVEAQFGDRLITLVTCAYHVDNGRFVVVARETTE